jgi:hypothetical protein
MSQGEQDYREISATSYNKPGHTTQGFLPDNKTEKKILIYSIIPKTKTVCLNITYRITRYY